VIPLVKYGRFTAYPPFGAWYDTTYVVLALMAIGVPKLASCHPLPVSLLNVTVPSSVPPFVHRCPVCVPVLLLPL
jgi:hypothetical protein